MKRTSFRSASLILLCTLLTTGIASLTAQAQARLRNPGVKRLLQTNKAYKSELPESSGSSGTLSPQESDQAPGDELIPPGVGIKQRLVLRRVFTQLSLSPEQTQKLKQLRQEIGNRVIVLSRLWKAQSDALEEALLGTDYDPKIVEKKVHELTETEAERTKLQYRILSRIREILTPDQAAKFRDMMREETQRPFNPGKAPLHRP